jgi:transposase-like protein
MPDETNRRYLFVAIDRATRWVFVQIKSHKTAAAARSFLNALHKACPIKMQKILTDNGKEFTDRLFASRERQATGNHEFDQLCQALNIEHRLTKLNYPWTNGQVERMKRTIKEATVKRYHYGSHDQLRQHLQLFVDAYNHARRLKTLHGLTPYE